MKVLENSKQVYEKCVCGYVLVICMSWCHWLFVESWIVQSNLVLRSLKD